MRTPRTAEEGTQGITERRQEKKYERRRAKTPFLGDSHNASARAVGWLFGIETDYGTSRDRYGCSCISRPTGKPSWTLMTSITPASMAVSSRSSAICSRFNV